MAFVGTLVIGFATSSSQDSGTPELGIALCLVAALAYAVGVTFQKPACGAFQPPADLPGVSRRRARVPPLRARLAAELGRARPASIAWLVYLCLFPTSIAFTSWTFALSRTAAGLGSTTYLVPPAAIVLGGPLLGEAPPLLAIVGGRVHRWRPARPLAQSAAVGAGLAITARSSRG